MFHLIVKVLLKNSGHNSKTGEFSRSNSPHHFPSLRTAVSWWPPLRKAFVKLVKLFQCDPQQQQRHPWTNALESMGLFTLVRDVDSERTDTRANKRITQRDKRWDRTSHTRALTHTQKSQLVYIYCICIYISLSEAPSASVLEIKHNTIINSNQRR